MISLSNDQLTVSIKEAGAELTSIVDSTSGIEYLWKGDPEIWGRHSPVLFPIVGRLKENVYQSEERLIPCLNTVLPGI
jgi:galactose mutarotase-like enzyme